MDFERKSGFKEKRAKQSRFKSLSQHRKERGEIIFKPEDMIYGDERFDNFKMGWRRGDFGLFVSGSSNGKTAVMLNVVLATLKRNKLSRPNTVAAIFSGEMTVDEIDKRWTNMTKDCPEYADKLYIISRYDTEGNSSLMNTETINRDLEDLQSELGVDVLICIVDHLLCLNDTENERKSAEGPLNQRIFDLSAVGKKQKCMVWLLSQTTKGQQKIGDVRLDINSCYGCSASSWFPHWYMTLHQPLKRCNAELPIGISAIEYVKVREQSDDDKLDLYTPYLFSFNKNTELLGDLTDEQFYLFEKLMPVAEQRRKEAEGGTGMNQYKRE